MSVFLAKELIGSYKTTVHETNLILTLTGGLAAGLAFGYVTNLLHLSPIVGYLIAGIAVGPFTPGFVADQHLAEQFAEIGVMLLMFGVGLHFHLEDLLRVRKIAIPGAIAQIAAATILGAVVADLAGWGWQAGVVYGLCLSVASTVVLTRVLVDNRALHTQTGHVAVGWLVVEDLFTVLVLVVLPILFDQQATSADIVSALGFVALKIVALAMAVFLLGKRFIPWLFTRVAESGSQELFTLTVLVTALGIAVCSAKLFDVSMALGAFLAGMVVGKSEFSLRAASEALPLRDAFAVLFFVSVGMLLDPAILIENAGLVAATLAVVIIGKALAAFALVVVVGYPIKVGLGVAVALAQIGEFSFILATLGKSLGVLNELAIHALVATAIISITLNPILYRVIPRVDRWIADRPRLARLLSTQLRKQLEHPSKESDVRRPTKHAIIVGYGPVGQTVARLLWENGISYSVIELNLETSRHLIADGVPVIYGDASRRETLESAGILTARVLILSASGIVAPEEVVRAAKELNPSIRVMARTGYARETAVLRKAGCEIVFSGEGEVALALTSEVLKFLGATAEQIARERHRVRKEIIDGDPEAIGM